MKRVLYVSLFFLIYSKSYCMFHLGEYGYFTTDETLNSYMGSIIDLSYESSFIKDESLIEIDLFTFIIPIWDRMPIIYVPSMPNESYIENLIFWINLSSLTIDLESNIMDISFVDLDTEYFLFEYGVGPVTNTYFISSRISPLKYVDISTSFTYTPSVNLRLNSCFSFFNFTYLQLNTYLKYYYELGSANFDFLDELSFGFTLTNKRGYIFW